MTPGVGVAKMLDTIRLQMKEVEMILETMKTMMMMMKMRRRRKKMMVISEITPTKD
jgi:hypothetical protein